LHDECAVAVGLLRQRVELGNGIVESLLGKVARTVGRVQDLVVEDGEVEGQAEADGVGWGQLSLGDVGGILGRACQRSRRKSILHMTNLVSLVGSSGSNLALLAGSELSEIAVVVTLPRSETGVSMRRKSQCEAKRPRH
jgi:hypothetical protein